MAFVPPAAGAAMLDRLVQAGLRTGGGADWVALLRAVAARDPDGLLAAATRLLDNADADLLERRRELVVGAWLLGNVAGGGHQDSSAMWLSLDTEERDKLLESMTIRLLLAHAGVPHQGRRPEHAGRCREAQYMSRDAYHKSAMGEHKLHPSTQMMSYGYDPAMSEGSVKPPVFLTSTFVFASAEEGAAYFDVIGGRRRPAPDEESGSFIPALTIPISKLLKIGWRCWTAAEAAVVTSSGMSAIATTFMSLLAPGDVIVRSTPLYGGSETLVSGMLARWGINALELPHPMTGAALETCLKDAMARGRVAIIYVETPANPTNDMLDFCGAERLHRCRVWRR